MNKKKNESKRTLFLARPVKANRGDLASQYGLVMGVLQNKNVSTIYVSTWYPEQYNTIPNVIPLKPSFFRGYLVTLQEIKLLLRKTPVLWGGGVDFQDTGSKIKMLIVLLRFTLLHILGSPIIIAFQGAGPVRSRFGSFVLKLLTKQISYAVVREETALSVLNRQGGMQEQCIHLSTDSTMNLKVTANEFGGEYLNKKGINLTKTLIAVNLRNWFYQRSSLLPVRKGAQHSQGQMYQVVANVAHSLSRIIVKYDAELLLFPMYRTEPEPWEIDIPLLHQLCNQLDTKANWAMTDENLNTEELLSILSYCKLVVGMRLHSTILAHAAGVPAVHLWYEHKGIDHFAHMSMKELLLSVDELTGNDTHTLDTIIDSVLNNHSEYKKRVKEKREQLRMKVEYAIELITKYLKTHDQGSIFQL